MKNKTIKAKVKSTGLLVEVYKLKSGGFCLCEDCKTKFKEDELIF